MVIIKKKMTDKNLVLIQLNEINFDLVEKYIEKYNFNNIKKLFLKKKYNTSSEMNINYLSLGFNGFLYIVDYLQKSIKFF